MTYLLERKTMFYVILSITTFFLFALVASVSAATTIGNNVSVGGTLTVIGVTTVQSDIDPNANNTIDLGAYDSAYNDIFASGTMYVDSLTTISSNLDVGGGFGSTGITLSATGVLSVDGAVWVSSTFRIGSAGGGDDFVVTNDAVTVGTSVNSSTLAVYGNTTLTGSLLSETNHNNLYDLGAYDAAWKDVFVSGTTYVAALTIDGNTTIGNATSDTLTVTARLAADLNPNANSTINLGAYDLAYNNVFTSGTIYTNTSTVNNPLATSTLILQSGGTTAFGGRIIFEDVDGSGCTELNALNGFVTATAISCP